MADVYCYATTPPEADDDIYVAHVYAFDLSYIQEHTTLHVPAGSISSYKAKETWKCFKSIVAIE